MKISSTTLLFTILASSQYSSSNAFSITIPTSCRLYAGVTTTTTPLAALSPSTIMDDDETTPERSSDEPVIMSPEDIPELNYDKDAVPVPHQPWRRGDTDGCEDPIDVPWRIEAEDIIRFTVSSVGAPVKDITWFMGSVVVTLSESMGWNVNGPSGPEVRVEEITEPQWFDEDDMEPQDDYGIYAGEEDGRIETQDDDGNISSGIPDDPYLEREFDEVTGTYRDAPRRPTRVATVRNKSFQELEDYEANGMKVRLNDRDERITKHKLNIDEFQTKLDEYAAENGLSPDEVDERAVELRARYLKSDDLAEYFPREFDNVGKEEGLDKLAMPTLERADGVDVTALSIIGRAINDALADPDVEDRLEILSRHEIILTSPGDEENYVETQRHFDEMRGEVVCVQTQDPFGSNRVLKGSLVDRNALDVIINVQGRMVTIPMNMIAYVAIPNADGSVLEPEYA